MYILLQYSQTSLISIFGRKPPDAATLLRNSKGPAELGNSNTYAEVNLCLFLLIPALEIVCRKTEVLNTISSD